MGLHGATYNSLTQKLYVLSCFIYPYGFIRVIVIISETVSGFFDGFLPRRQAGV